MEDDRLRFFLEKCCFLHFFHGVSHLLSADGFILTWLAVTWLVDRINGSIGEQRIIKSGQNSITSQRHFSLTESPTKNNNRLFRRLKVAFDAVVQ